MNINELQQLQQQYRGKIDILLNRGDNIFKNAKEKIDNANKTGKTKGPDSQTMSGPLQTRPNIMETDDTNTETPGYIRNEGM